MFLSLRGVKNTFALIGRREMNTTKENENVFYYEKKKTSVHSLV